MRLLEIIPSLQSAGAERLVVELSNELCRREGVNVTILQLYPFNENDILKPLVDKKIPIYSLNKPRGLSFLCFFKLFVFVKKGKYDVVHTHTSATSYLLLSSVIYRHPVYCSTIHSEAKREAGDFVSSIVKKILYKLKLCRPVTISEKSNLSFRNYYHMDAPIIYNGIKPFKSKIDFSLNESYNVLRLVHIARTHPIKNQPMLYRCINRLVQDGFIVKLYHYGRFYQKEVNDELYSLKTDNIIIAGETKDPQEVLLDADALCLSSKMEGMPMTIIEAFSVGCPVISTPVGGCVNMIEDGVNGILSQSISEDDYYEALKRFAKMTTDERTLMRRNALQSFDKYNISKTADKYLEYMAI
jgi:glycosyltransferase involved in cell wall biosynthesis